MQVGELVKYRNTKSKDCGIVLENGDVFVYWFSRQSASAERSGDMKVLTIA